MNEQLLRIKKEVKEFQFQNQEKYEIINKLLEIANNLSEETYPDAIQLIQNHSDLFFKDHPSVIFLFTLIIHTCYINFKHFEINLNIIVHFTNKIKSAKTTENELIQICAYYVKSIYYLFSKHFFTIDAIIEQSSIIYFIFIYFWPEIDHNDHEYAILREESLSFDLFDPEIARDINFLNQIKKNPENHILNRKSSYHPSSLHKSIREDDIETFQSILSKNNIDFNSKIEYSYYERSPFLFQDLTLIQIAAIYGSIKIFKFLIIQDENIGKCNLLKYAYFGRNYDIIHLCENFQLNEEVQSIEKAYLQPIATHQNDLLDYYIENYGDQIKEDEMFTPILNAFKYDETEEEEENFYLKYLNYESLIVASESFNYQIVLKCLEKIVFIVQNIELVGKEYEAEKSFLNSFEADPYLFKFIYSQKSSTVDKYLCGCYFHCLNDCLDCNMNDAFKFLFFELIEKVDCYSIFQNTMMYNHDMTNFILDLQFEDNALLTQIKDKIKIIDLEDALLNYNEDMVFKIIKLLNVEDKKEDFCLFDETLTNFLSSKMILSLFRRISLFVPKEIFINISFLFKDEKYSSIIKFINELNNK